MTNSRFKAFWDFISLSGGEVISKIAGFLAFAYLARTLDPAAYGAVEVAAALLSFFLLLIDFGYGPIGARQILRHPGQTLHYATAISSARIVLVLVSIPAMCLIGLFMGQPQETVLLIWVFSVSLLSAPWNQRWLLQGLDRMHLVAFGQLARMSVFALGVFLFVRDEADLLTVGVVEVFSAVAMAAYFVVAQRYVGVPVRVTWQLSRIIDITRQSLATGLSQVAWALYQYLPTVMIATLVGGVQTGWFAAAHRIVFSVVSFSMVYHFNLYPVVAMRLKQSPESFREIVYPSYRVAAWAGISIALVFSLFAEPLCVFIFGEDFRSAGLPLAILIWTLPVTLMSGHSRWALIAAYKQRFVFYAQAIGLLATVLAGLALIPDHAALGGSVTMLISTLAVWLTAHFHASRNIIRMPFLRAIACPLLLSAGVLLSAGMYNEIGLPGRAGLLLLYAVAGLLFDRAIVSDIKTMLKVKSQSPGNAGPARTRA